MAASDSSVADVLLNAIVALLIVTGLVVTMRGKPSAK